MTARNVTSEPRGAANPWWSVVAMGLAMAVGMGAISHYVFGAFIKAIATEFSWDRGTVSAGISLSMIGVAGASPIFGALIDRWGPRAPALISVGVFALIVILVSLVTARWQFYGLFLMMGVVAGGVTGAPYSKAITAKFGSRRGLAFGLGAAGYGLGGVVLPFFAAFALTHFSWRLGFVGVGLLVAAVSFPTVWFGLAGIPRAEPRPGGGKRSTLTLWRSRPLWLIGLAIGLIACSVSGMMVHAVPLMTDRGLTPGVAASVMSIVAAASVIGRIAGGYLMDLFFAPVVSAAAFLVAALGALLIILGGSGALLIVGYVCVGLILGAETDALAYLISRYFPQSDFGKVYGIVYLMFAGSGAAAAYLMGLSFDLFGSYTVGMAISATLAVLAALVVICLGPYLNDVKGHRAAGSGHQEQPTIEGYARAEQE